MTKSGPNDAWIRSVVEWIEHECAQDGGEFVVEFPEPLGEAQERLLRTLGVTVKISPNGADPSLHFEDCDG